MIIALREPMMATKDIQPFLPIQIPQIQSFGLPEQIIPIHQLGLVSGIL
jgi:hypothetical protein